MGLIPGIGVLGKVGLNYADISVISMTKTSFTDAYNYGNSSISSTQGDLLIWCVETNYNIPVIFSSGIINLGSWGGNGTSIDIWYKFSTGESTTIQFNNITENGTMIMMQLRNVNPTNPFCSVASYSQNSSITSQQCPEVVTTLPKSLIVNLVGARDGSWSGNEASGWTNSNLISFSEWTESNYDITHLYAAKGFKSSAGNSGITTLNTVTASPTIGVTFSLNPKLL
jgi:hypothetical protein